jgi:cytoskeletal protein RodZ
LIKINYDNLKILKNLFLFNNKNKNNKSLNNGVVDQYREIAKLVKEARIQQNLTINELSLISRIPERTINSIENNNKNIRPKYPFIRSILIKLEECLGLKKNILVELAIREKEPFKRGENDFLVGKFDLINTWQGTLLYFFILVLTIFILKRYFVLNVNVIEIQNIENKIIDK